MYEVFLLEVMVIVCEIWIKKIRKEKKKKDFVLIVDLIVNILGIDF